MDSRSLLAMLQLYFSKKKRLKDEISHTRFECQRMLRRCKRQSNLKHKLIVGLFLVMENSLRIYSRQVWSFQKSDEWWTSIVASMTHKQFKENFRLERSTYAALLRQLEPHLRRKDTNYRACISVERRICCALYSLGSSSELRTIGNLFGIGKSTAGEILHDFCAVLTELFFYRLIRFPTTSQDIQRTINGFSDKFSYPMCLGALDGTHISVKAPLGLETDFY